MCSTLPSRQEEIGAENRSRIPGTSACLITSFVVCLLCAGCFGLSGTPTITPLQLPAAHAGVPYAATLTASGVGTPYSWSVASGALPPGLILNAGTGGVSGIPTQIGSFKFVVQLFVSSSPSFKAATGSISLDVDSPSPQITTSVLPNAQIGMQFQASLTATAGSQPYQWSIASGTLPPGISLNAASGILSGTPTQGGQFDFSVQVSDSSSPKPQTAMKALTLSVLAFALQINSAALPNGQVGASFQASVSGSGGIAPYTWSVVGALPSGLSLNASSGTIVGTPTQAGASTFTIVLTDSSQQTTQKSLSITIVPVGVQPLAISTTTLAQSAVGTAYSVILQATGGTPPYTWTLPAISGPLPTGLALDSATGKIAGTPTSAGLSGFTVQVQDSGALRQTALQAFSFTVTAASSLDQYGGDAHHACAGTMKNGSGIPGATGFFYLYKDTNLKHWMFCDPLGNRFFYQGVQVIDGTYSGSPNNVNIAAKYGAGGYDYEKAQARRLLALGFNAIGEYAHVNMPPACTGNGPGNPVPLPFVWLVHAFRDSPMLKNIYVNLPPVYNSYRGGEFDDAFDPAYTTNVNTFFGPSDTHVGFCSPGTPAGLDANPWLIGITIEDSDTITGLKQVNTDIHLGFLAAISSPYQPTQGVKVFADPVFYTKTNLQSYLTREYGTVGALNAAWGSNYTTLGSTATTAAPEAIGIGNGVATSFSHTFAHGVIDPASILISVGGVGSGGDCPWFGCGCCGMASGTGTIVGSLNNISAGTVTYSSGGTACGVQAAPCITVTFSVAPANGAAITATYQYGGWPRATAGGTGLLDEDGSSSWIPAIIANPPVGIVATDLDGFNTQIAKQYFSVISARLRAALPHHLVFGPDGMYFPNRPGVYTQMGTYLDAAVMAGTENFPGVGHGTDSTTAGYNGLGIPIIAYNLIRTSNDSQFVVANCVAATGQDCVVNQPQRGQLYYSFQQQWFNSYVGGDGYGYIVGVDWWQWVDRNNERANYGFVTLDDNLYDGIESCGTSVKDPWGFTTTPEPIPGCYGDFVTAAKAANRIWLGP